MNFLSIAAVMALGMSVYNINSEKILMDLEKQNEKIKINQDITKNILKQEKSQYNNESQYLLTNMISERNVKSYDELRTNHSISEKEVRSIFLKIDTYLKKYRIPYIENEEDICSKVFESSSLQSKCINVLKEDYNFLITNDDGSVTFKMDKEQKDIEDFNLNYSNSNVNDNNNVMISSLVNSKPDFKNISKISSNNKQEFYSFSNGEIIIPKEEIKETNNSNKIGIETEYIKLNNSADISILEKDVKEISNSLNTLKLQSSYIKSSTSKDNSQGSNTGSNVGINNDINKKRLNLLLENWNKCAGNTDKEIIDSEYDIKKYLGRNVWNEWYSNFMEVDTTCYEQSSGLNETIIAPTDTVKSAREIADEIVNLNSKKDYITLFIHLNYSTNYVKSKLQHVYGQAKGIHIYNDINNKAKRHFIDYIYNYKTIIDHGIGLITGNYSKDLDTLITEAKNKILLEKASGTLKNPTLEDFPYYSGDHNDNNNKADREYNEISSPDGKIIVDK